MKSNNTTYLSLFLGFALALVGVASQAQNTLVLNGAITVLDGGTAGTPVYLSLIHI